MATFAFIFVVILTVVAVAIILLVLVVKGMFRGVGNVVGSVFAPLNNRRLPHPPAGMRRCIDPRCLADNPGPARFCKRCGSSLDTRSVRGRTPVFNRAAMW
jgi:hypothetical protein